MTAQTTALIRPSTSADAVETRTFPLRSGGTLEIFNSSGEIRISAWDKDEVALKADFKSNSGKEHMSLEVHSVSNSLGLIAKYPEGRSRGRGGLRLASCKMELKVPNNIIIDVNNDIDDIVLENVSGVVTASTTTGDIRGSIQNIQDNLDMSTVVGDIKIKFLTPPNGNLTATAVTGNMKIPAGATDAEFNGNSLRAKYGDESARLSFNTVTGSIDIQ
jgi:DUF4097 and DUF4098 domain-containing protein YvlB